MKPILVALVALTITRDAMTKLPTTVAAHEVEVVKIVFGEDNVVVNNERAGTIEVDPDHEGERLAGKYGQDAVQRAHGENFKGKVAQACIAAQVTADAGEQGDSALDAMTKAQLLEHAAAHGIEVNPAMNKAALVAAIEAAAVPA